MTMKAPLAGVRVLDLSRLLPGPLCTRLLADFGASVDKLEDPAGGDYVRYAPPLREGRSALFEILNRGKRGIALGLKDPEARAAFEALVGRYDVLCESFRPGVLARLGIDLPPLRARHPR